MLVNVLLLQLLAVDDSWKAYRGESTVAKDLIILSLLGRDPTKNQIICVFDK
jgi:hypothetical protein